MKVNKKILICAMLVLVLFLCINAGSATEPLNQTLGADIGDEIAIGDASNDNLSASGDTLVVDANGGQYTSISAAVSDATGGETIFIKNGEYTETAKIDIGTKQLTFTGESRDGVIIKSGDNDLFYTTGSGYSSLVISGVTFKDISMTGARTPIFVGGDGNVSITDCTFDNCASRYGAIRIYTSGSVTVDNCKLLNTKSSNREYSSAIDFGGSGTADYTIKNTIIDGSSISSASTASYIFGVIYNEKTAGTVTLDNVTISNCNLASSSGLITTKGNMNIKRSKLVNNYVYRDLAIAGFIFVNGAKTVNVESTLIANNTQPNNFLTSNSAATFDLNYNNIQNNTFNTAFTNPDNGVYTLNANYWGSNTLPDGITASTWVVNDNGEYKLNTGDALEKDVPGLTEEPAPAYIYVSPDGTGDGSSKDTPMSDFNQALNIVPDGGTIYILNGQYNITSPIMVNKNVSFVGESRDGVIMSCSANAGLFLIGYDLDTFADLHLGSVSISGISFLNYDNLVAYAYSSVDEFSVTNCIIDPDDDDLIFIQVGLDAMWSPSCSGTLNFKNNVLTSNATIAVYGAFNANINDNILIGGIIENITSATVNADYNYWGSETPQTKLKLNNWIKFSAETNASEIYNDESAKITIKANLNDGSSAASHLPDYPIAVSLSAEGTLSQTDLVLSKGLAQVTYTSDVARNDNIGINVLGQTLSVPITVKERYTGIVYVNTTGSDDNEGSINAPVATVGKAIELANAGSHEIIINEGTYVGNGYAVTDDLKVTGNGKVTLDANNEGGFFATGYPTDATKIELSNLILANAKGGVSAGSGCAINSYANEVILDNVTIVNSQANGYLIKSKGKLTIKDSNIAKSMSGNVIHQDGSGDILITNTTFKDNSIVDTISVYGVIYLSSGSGTLTIEDSKFINNTARQGVIKGSNNHNIAVSGSEFINNTDEVSYGGAIYATGSTLTVSDSKFINNKANRDGGAIYVGSRTTATVDKSVFINNAAGTTSEGDAIYNGNKLSVSNSVLLTNAAHHLIYNDGEDNVVNAQNNWWGTNDDPSNLVASGTYEDYYDEEQPCGEVDVSNWATMDASFTPDDAQAGDEVTVTAVFSNANLPDGIEVTFTSTSGLNTVVSTVGAQASTTYTIAANDEAINATSSDAVIEMPIASPALENIVTQDNFYTFFDESGILLNTVEFDELIFQGNFSDLAAGYVILNKKVTITGDDAVLNNMGIVVSASDVTLNDLTLIANTSLGDLVYVEGSNVNLNNLDITYTVGDESARAISIIKSTDVTVNNATIAFESHLTDSANDGCAINIEESQKVVVNGSEINSSLPALYVNYEAVTTQFMGLDKVNPIRIVQSNNVEITKNIIKSQTNDYSQQYATIQAIAVLETNDCLVDSNNITLTDEFAQAGQDIYLYGISFAYDEELVMSNNNFTIHTNGGKEAAGTAYAIQGIESKLSIIGNNITTFSNGPNLAIYVTSMMGEPSIALIENNTLNVTGFAAAGNDWALVSGIEIQNGDVQIHNNTIYTYNVADEYDEDAYLSGISYVQWMYGERAFDIQDNFIYTEGKYAIYLLAASNSIITGNTLYAHDLEGSDAVFIQSGDNNDVSGNRPTNVVTNDTFYEFFDDNGLLLDTVGYNELIFQGKFSDLVSYITLDKTISITGDEAELNDIAFIIAGDDVKLKDMTLVASSNLGNLIDIAGKNALIANMNISYVVSEAANAINVYQGANGAQILNNTIYFESTVDGYAVDEETNAICVNSGTSVYGDEDPITGLVIDGNNITAVIPAFLADVYENEYFVMGISAVNGVRINGAEDFKFTNNNLNVTTNWLYRTTPTYQAIYVASSSGLIDANNITMIDTFTPTGKDVYIDAMVLIKDEDLTISNNNFNISTTGGKEEAGSAYAIVAIGSDFSIIGNNITTVSNGPNLAVYFPSNMGAPCDAVISDNFMNVTGLATSAHDTGLVSGIEVQTGNIELSGNTIYTYNIGDYDDDNYLFGVSYVQDGLKSKWNITDNTIYTEGKYAISLKSADDATINDNNLYAHKFKGDKAVFIGDGSGNVVENNLPMADITVGADSTWIGTNGVVTVNVVNGTGSVTIKVNGKEFTAELDENGTATKEIPAEDLVAGENIVTATYESTEYAPATNTTVLAVLDGVVTNGTYMRYFNQEDNGKLFDCVPNGATLDFQGLFLGKFPVYIDKSVNVISSTDDALFDSGATYAGNAVNSFNIIAGGDYTNITGLKFINCCLYIKGASNVTVDGVSIVANKRGVGSGTGFLSIHTGAYNTVVKNGYFENGGTGSSLLVLGKGGAYALFDHNVFNITGSSGNILSANQFVGSGDAPEHVSYTNNVLYNSQPGSAFCYAMTVSGSGNLLENNTIYHNGSGILNQYGASSSGNVYRNNTIYGNTNFNPSANSIVENNKIYAVTNIAANTTAVNNVFKNVAISGTNTTFTNNNVSGTVTVNGNNNRINDNNIISTEGYAVDLKSTTGNNVTGNYLVAKELYGQDAVNAVKRDAVLIENNRPVNPEIVVKVENITVGEDALINVTLNENVAGTVVVNVNGETYDVEITAGKGSVPVSGLAPSDYTVTATFTSSDITKFGDGKNSTVFNVAKLESEVNITVSDAELGNDAVITVSIPGATGNVTVIVNGKEEEIPLDENGNATYPIDDIAAGDYNVVVIYPGDMDHGFAYAAETFSVDKLASDVNVTVKAGSAGEKSIIEFNVTEGATGTVVIDVNGTRYVVDVADGKLEVVLDAGDYSVVATYDGDDSYNASVSDAETIVVSEKQAANIQVEIPDDIKVGDKIIINVTADTDAEIIVYINGEAQTFLLQGAPLGASLMDVLKYNLDKKVAYEVTSEGIYNVTVIAKENGDYAAQTVTKIFEANKKDAEITIGEITADIGDTVTINATTESDGALTIKVNGETVTGEYPITKAGTYTVVVESAATDAYNAGFATYTFEVAEPTEQNITVVVDGKEYNATVVNGTATVDTDMDDLIANLTDKLVDANDKVANLTADLADANDKVANLTADLADANDKVANLTADLADANDKVANLTADLADANDKVANLTADLADANDKVANLTADLADANDKVANLTDALADLTDDLANATDKIADLTDELADAQANATALAGELADAQANATALAGELADAQANATALAGELADAQANATALAGELADAQANATALAGELADAQANATALAGELADAYQTIEDLLKQLEEAKANATNSTLPETVVVDGVEYPIEYVNGTAIVETNKTAPVVPKSSEFSEITISDDLTISIVLKDGDGNIIASAPITYTVNGAVQFTTTDNDGKFTVKGEDGALITINYAGDANITGTNITLKLNSAAVPEVVKVAAQFNISNRAITLNGYAVDGPAGEQGIYYATTLLDANGKPISNVYLEFAVNNKIYNRTTYENGSFNPYKLNMVRAGRYTMAFNFAGDENYTNAFACVCVDLDKKPITIKAPAKTYKAATKTKKYTATLSTIPSVYDGKVYLSPKAVKLTVNGKTFTGKTNSKGQVTFKITNLNKKGKYTATISYKGDKTYEEATQKVKLTIK